jgi:hypothetical protein
MTGVICDLESDRGWSFSVEFPRIKKSRLAGFARILELKT